MLVVLASLLLGVALLTFLATLKVELRRRKDRKGLPGPADAHQYFWGMTSNILRRGREGTLVSWVRETSRKSGYSTWCYSIPVKTVYIIHDPEDLRYAYGKNFENYIHGSRRDAFQDMLGDGIFNSDGEVWRQQRHAASHLFTANQLSRMEVVFQRKAQQLASMLEEGGAFDLQRLFYCSTFDAINEIAFGRAVDSLGGAERDLEFQQAFDNANEVCSERFVKPYWKLLRLLGIGKEGENKRNLDIITRYIEDALAENKEGGSKDDLLTIFENAIGDGERYVSRRDIVLNFLIAGRDTTASALTWTFYELSRHPEVVAKLEKEIREVASVQNMQYAQAVFQEVLRLYPSVPMDGKMAAKDDRLPSGVFIPKGSVLSFNPCCYTMNPSLYPEPEKFDPSRWLDDDGMCKPYDQWLFPQFNMGPRICLGRHMAALEAKIIMSEVLSRCDIKVKEGYEPVPRLSAVLQMKEGLPVEVTPKPLL